MLNYVVLLCDCAQRLARKQQLHTVCVHGPYHQACLSALITERVVVNSTRPQVSLLEVIRV